MKTKAETHPNARVGEYSTRKDREECEKELRAAHFMLGNEKHDGTTSYVRDYTEYKTSEEGDRDDRKVNSKVLSRTNFILGLDRDKKESIYKKEFGFKKAEDVTLDRAIVRDLRATHYTLGNEPPAFRSVQQQDYAQPAEKIATDGDIEGMKKTMRTQNFKFGDEPMSYQSSNAATYRSPSAQPSLPPRP